MLVAMAMATAMAMVMHMETATATATATVECRRSECSSRSTLHGQHLGRPNVGFASQAGVKARRFNG